MRWCAVSVQLPGRRARLAASDRHLWTDAEPYRASRSRGRGSSQWNRPERAGREWYAASVQLPGRRARFALQAVIGGRTRSLIVRRAAGKEDHRSGTARSAPGASGALHPSDCPGGEHGLRFRPSLVDGRGALSCVAQPGKRIIAVEPPGTRRARVVRCIRPIARAGSAACGFRPSLVDGGGAFAVRRAAGKVRDTRDGVLRLRHIRPVARTGGIRGGGEHGLRLQTVTNGRTRSLCRASRSRGRESSQWNRPERAGREWYAASVQLPGRRARFALQAVIGGRTRSLIVRRVAGKRIAAVESPGTRRARVVCEAVRCIRPIAWAGSAACGFRPFSMDGREDFP